MGVIKGDTRSLDYSSHIGGNSIIEGSGFFTDKEQ